MSESQAGQNALPKSSTIDNALLVAVTRAVLPYLGPHSITVVKRASRATDDVHALVRMVADEVTNASHHAHFVAAAYRAIKVHGDAREVKVVSGAPAGRNRAKPRPITPITAEFVHRAEEALALTIGPLAGVLAQRYAGVCENSREYFEKLATHLRNDEEREHFFDRVRSSGGLIAVKPKK